jgi:Uncharacterised protein family (UPF0149)
MGAVDLRGSPEERAVRTVFNRYNEVSTTLSERPHAYRPIFMIDRDGSVVARDWAVGFMLGIGLRSDKWAESILLTEHRSLLTPILVYHDLGDGLLPDMPPAEKLRRRATAYHQIPQIRDSRCLTSARRIALLDDAPLLFRAPLAPPLRAGKNRDLDHRSHINLPINVRTCERCC